MKNFKTIFIGLILISGNALAQTVDEIISKYIDAKGGKEKLASLNTLKVISNIQMGPDMKAPMTLIFVNNKSMRLDLTIQGMTMVQCLNGESGWYISPFQGKTEPEKMNEEMLKASKEESDITGPLFNYKEKGNKVELVGKEEMEGTDVFKLKVTRPNGDVVYMYIDASNYLLLKETQKQKMKDKEIESETLFSNYKMVNGINFAFSMEQRQVGESSGQSFSVESVEVNPKVDESIFKMPEVAKK